jgi:hypothetical protein
MFSFPRKGEFLIIRYHSRLTFGGEDGNAYGCWGCVTCRRNYTGLKEREKPYVARLRELTREDALEAIERFGLVESLSDKGDKIYDTPDGAFKLKYGGETLIDDRFLI